MCHVRARECSAWKAKGGSPKASSFPRPTWSPYRPASSHLQPPKRVTAPRSIHPTDTCALRSYLEPSGIFQAGGAGISGASQRPPRAWSLAQGRGEPLLQGAGLSPCGGEAGAVPVLVPGTRWHRWEGISR